MNSNKIPADSYYSTYQGHSLFFLETALSTFRKNNKSIIFLAGDSSLDNKFWFEDEGSAIKGYESMLYPPRMKKDVCYWINNCLQERELNDYVCLNTSIEASTLADRSLSLLPQDNFIQQNITEDDYLIVSIGGNDIALKPLLCTICNIVPLVYCTCNCCLEKTAIACPPKIYDCGCFCCGLPGCISGLCGFPIGFGYFVDMFKNKVKNYVEKLISRRKPKKVIICMIYYPNEISGGSWADCSLSLLCYNYFPSKLQTAIRKVFEEGTNKIKIEGTRVVPFPLFKILDGKNPNDYVQRVEPSVQGGKKMANAFCDELF